MAEGTHNEQRAAGLPAEWRAAFCHFVETGEAEKPFLDFLESNKEAQAAVEVIFNEQAAAFERLGAALRFAKAAPEIGAIESTGEHKGEIYGGIYPADNKPIWILEEPKPMTHYDAVELKGRTLPTKKQGQYIDTIKDKGALKDIFARHSDSSSSAGYFWLAEHNSFDVARYQQFSDGSQSINNTRNLHLPVLSVRR
jgi:hypothetical protein